MLLDEPVHFVVVGQSSEVANKAESVSLGLVAVDVSVGSGGCFRVGFGGAHHVEPL